MVSKLLTTKRSKTYLVIDKVIDELDIMKYLLKIESKI